MALCLKFINAFNVAYVLVPEIEEQLRRQSWFAYVPDVHDLSGLVGSQASRYTMLTLAVISIIFDAFIFFGSMKKRTEYVPKPRHASDNVSLTPRAPTLGVANTTNIAGSGSGNESSRRVLSAKDQQDKREILRREDYAYDESARSVSEIQAADDEDETKEKILIAAFMEPPTVRQFLHFGYVVMRAVVKCQKLGIIVLISRMMKQESAAKIQRIG
ncbi:uncharacterized protein LOC119398047 [Rhipicephalus sanguineus]|uniref:uncharacterized protein LOC119398047 n=1 Tax=Rhipicephalus sanguineus TaxID=34632 RepID=UPI0020C30A85|nr:uncharacterized protein LOC119398047 [Rhipicephalus sanguineus]